MYLTHFGLEREPFSISPDPRALYMSERHREALAHLLYGLQAGGGIIVLTGEVGAGKTTVARCFLAQVPASCKVAYVYNPKLSAIELLETVCEEFGVAVPKGGDALPTIKQHVDPLNRMLLDLHARGRQAVLVIDEAQHLAPEVLEQLRLLTNLETHERKLLQIILIGQPELRELLARPALEQVAQRIIARYHLGPLDAADTARYVAHRLQVAGGHGPLPFKAEALEQLHRESGGVPRRINLIADRALLGSMVEGKRAADAAIVRRAAAEVRGEADSAHRTPADLALGMRRTMLAGLVLLLMASAGWAWWQARSPAPAARGSETRAAAAAPLAASVVPGAAPPAAAPAPVAAAPSPWSAAPPLTPADWQSDDEQQAWAALARLHGRESGRGDACATLEREALGCLQTTQGSLPALRQWNRPAWLSLVDAEGRRGTVLWFGEDDAGMRLATTRGQPRRLDPTRFALLWRGDMGTLWRQPPGWRRPLTVGDRGPAVDLLARALPTRAGQPWVEGSPFDADLQHALARWQLAEGLKPDGMAGASTFMRLPGPWRSGEPSLAVTPASPAPAAQASAPAPAPSR